MSKHNQVEYRTTPNANHGSVEMRAYEVSPDSLTDDQKEGALFMGAGARVTEKEHGTAGYKVLGVIGAGMALMTWASSCQQKTATPAPDQYIYYINPGGDTVFYVVKGTDTVYVKGDTTYIHDHTTTTIHDTTYIDVNTGDTITVDNGDTTKHFHLGKYTYAGQFGEYYGNPTGQIDTLNNMGMFARLAVERAYYRPPYSVPAPGSSMGRCNLGSVDMGSDGDAALRAALDAIPGNAGYKTDGTGAFVVDPATSRRFINLSNDAALSAAVADINGTTDGFPQGSFVDGAINYLAHYPAEAARVQSVIQQTGAHANSTGKHIEYVANGDMNVSVLGTMFKQTPYMALRFSDVAPTSTAWEAGQMENIATAANTVGRKHIEYDISVASGADTAQMRAGAAAFDNTASIIHSGKNIDTIQVNEFFGQDGGYTSGNALATNLELKSTGAMRHSAHKTNVLYPGAVDLRHGIPKNGEWHLLDGIPSNHVQEPQHHGEEKAQESSEHHAKSTGMLNKLHRAAASHTERQEKLAAETSNESYLS